MAAISRFISYIFHPLLMPSYAMLLVLWIYPYFFAHLDIKGKGFMMINIFINTFAFPLLAVAIMKGLGMVKSFKLETREERILPYIAVMLFYIWCYMSTNKAMDIGEFPSDILLGAFISAVALFLINLVFKISIHAVGIGNLLGVVLLLVVMSSFNLEWLFLGVLLLAGLIGSARLYLGAHQSLDIYSGYFVGLLGQLIAFRMGEILPVL